MMQSYRILAGLGLTFALAACSSVEVDEYLPDKKVEYKREAQAERNLEIPPDLTTDRINDRMSVPDSFGAGSTSYTEYVTDREIRGIGQQPAAYRSDVLPQLESITVERDGDKRWLVIDAPVEVVWPRVIDFWQENGILLEEQDPSVGIMRTSWLENRAEIADDIITRTLRNVLDSLYEAGTRDQFRIRLERAGSNSTELFLTHFGMQETITGTVSGGQENSVWNPRPRDPGLEAEMLRRMMVFLGTADQRARTQLAAQGKAEQKGQRSQLLKSSDQVQLLINDRFSRAWRLTGLALDRVGFAVEDRDRSAGIYYVRYHDPAAEVEEGGWLSSLKFWGSDDTDKARQYQVRVEQGAEYSVVTVLDENAKLLNSPTAVRILNLLHEQIR